MDFNTNFVNICKQAKLVGASCVVVKNGEVINKIAYGYSSIEKNQLTTEKTIYRIASISKTVGAIGLLQLYEKGLFDLDDDISNYLGFLVRNPKFPDKKITVKMILTQTSSITDGYDDESPEYDDIHVGYNGVNGSNWDVDLRDLLLENGKYYTPLTFSDYEPGKNFIYSNFGCGIMACIIETLSGEHYDEYMINHIFKPLNIDASFKAKNIIHQDMIADLYYPDNKGGYITARTKEQFVKGGYKEFPIGNCFRGPAGGLFINMPDLAKIMMMLMNDGIYNGTRILKKETVDLMYQQHWFGYGDGGDYKCKGLQMKILHNFDGKPLRGHTGGAYGVRSYLFYDRRNKTGACFITNGGYYKHTEEHILDIFKSTLESMFSNYWIEPSTKFSFTINSNIAYVNERRIIMESIPYINNENIYLPAINLADGLNIVINTNQTNNALTYTKNNYSIDVVPITYNNIYYVNIIEILNTLKIEYKIENNQYIINY